jgi:predicted RNase H-like HicB family nuclease
MNKADRYTKLVVCSDEDNCFIGTCPELFYGGCDGADATQMFAELCELAEEAIETLEEVGKPLPKPLSAEDLGKLLQRREARA